MEEKLQQFLNDHSNYDPSDSLDAVARFVHRQVIHIAEDCLTQSQKQLITSHYFFEMSENLEKLLIEVCIKISFHMYGLMAPPLFCLIVDQSLT